MNRNALFEPVTESLTAAGWECVPGYGWERWDLEIRRPARLWLVRLSSVTEYHAGGRCLTRVRLHAVPTAFFGLTRSVVIAAALVGALVWGQGMVLSIVIAFGLFLAVSCVDGLCLLFSLRRRIRRVAHEIGISERP